MDKWIKKITNDPVKIDQINRSLAIAETWWHNQPEAAEATIERNAVAMGLTTRMVANTRDNYQLVRILVLAHLFTE